MLLPKHHASISPTLLMILVYIQQIAEKVMISESHSTPSCQWRPGFSSGTRKSMKVRSRSSSTTYINVYRSRLSFALKGRNIPSAFLGLIIRTRKLTSSPTKLYNKRSGKIVWERGQVDKFTGLPPTRSVGRSVTRHFVSPDSAGLCHSVLRIPGSEFYNVHDNWRCGRYGHTNITTSEEFWVMVIVNNQVFVVHSFCP